MTANFCLGLAASAAKMNTLKKTDVQGHHANMLSSFVHYHSVRDILAEDLTLFLIIWKPIVIRKKILKYCLLFQLLDSALFSAASILTKTLFILLKFSYSFVEVKKNKQTTSSNKKEKTFNPLWGKFKEEYAVQII